jgi:hypothetical protein
MKKIIDYKITEESSEYSLAKIVNKDMQEGWQPLGGVNLIPYYDAIGQGYINYVQAMVKYEEEPTTKKC